MSKLILSLCFISLLFTTSCQKEDTAEPIIPYTEDTIVSPDSSHFSHFTLSRYYGNTNSYFYFDIPSFIMGYNYRVDFNGDGNYEQVIYGSIQNVQIKRTGTFDVRVLTIDKEGKIYSNKKSVTITDINLQLSSFLDTRDGKNYQTTKIGNQTWFAENLNYSSANAKENGIYGKLYNFSDACKVCPSGWHLPENWEIDTLLANLSGLSQPKGVVLKNDNSWDSNVIANNESGFSAMPGGSFHGYNSIGYIEQGVRANFWTNYFHSIGPSGYAAKPLVVDNENNIVYTSPASIGWSPFYSVRCIQN